MSEAFKSQQVNKWQTISSFSTLNLNTMQCISNTVTRGNTSIKQVVAAHKQDYIPALNKWQKNKFLNGCSLQKSCQVMCKKL